MEVQRTKTHTHIHTQHSLHHIQHKTLSASTYLIIVHIKSLARSRWQLSVFL